MSIEIFIVRVIIPKIVLTEKFYGSIDVSFNHSTNQSFQKDNDLVSLSFSDLDRVKNFVPFQVKHRLENNTIEFKDFIFINLDLGNF